MALSQLWHRISRGSYRVWIMSGLRDARQAFKDFESAARGGEVRGWFRLGRDYETVGDLGRAKDYF